MIEEDAFATLAGKHRRERWRREWINRFRERQRTARNWVEFVEIAKWCARSTTGASADAEQQALELGYQRLAASLLHGEFEVRGRSEILYLDPTVMTDGMTPRWRLSRAQFDVVAKICESSLPMPVLARCWLKRDRAAAWLRLHGYPLPPYLEGDARLSSAPDKLLAAAIESARSALGWPGRTGTGVRWTVFCDRVRSEGQSRGMRPYSDRHIQRVVGQIKTDANPHRASDTDPT